MNWIKSPELLERNRLIYAHYESVKGTCRNPRQVTAAELGISYTIVQLAILNERVRIGWEIEAIMKQLNALTNPQYAQPIYTVTAMRNYIPRAKRPAYVTIRKTGEVSFNKSALIDLSLRHNQLIEIGKRDGQWFINLNDVKAGFRISTVELYRGQTRSARLATRVFADAPGKRVLKLELKKTNTDGLFFIDFPVADTTAATPRMLFMPATAPQVQLQKTA